MANDHWFDGLHRSLTAQAPRRGLVHFAGSLLASAVWQSRSRPGEAKGKQRRGKHKHNHKGNDDKKPKHPGTCSHGACAAEWPNDKANHDYCELICRQCDGNDPREFCIVEGDPADPAKVATCCIDGAECCGARCCGDPRVPTVTCCNGQCTSLLNDAANCGQCGNRCPAGETCVYGQCSCSGNRKRCIEGCTNTQTDPRNCRDCGTRCPEDWLCCEGTCYDTESSSTN
jgi:hypothetical protein